MKLIKKGKTKDVYSLDNGNISLSFKDDVTGTDGVFDPGANTVGLSIDGMGNGGLRLTVHFFELLRSQGIKTHFVAADVDSNTMEVLPCTMFGKGIEVICRFKAVGSFIRRYGEYASDGQDLGGFVEITLKDDERGDPPVSKDALAILGILTQSEYESLKAQTVRICGIIKDELAKCDCELYDIKLEFGRQACFAASGGESGEVMLIDEISGGNMRVYKDGEIVKPLELIEIVLGE